MLNVNHGRNKALLDACRPLKEYAWLMQEVRKNRKGTGNNDQMEIEDAVEKAISDMPKDYILKPFLEAHRAEVRGMLLTEYNEAETMRRFERDGERRGEKRGETKMAALMEKLFSLGRFDDARKAASDENYRRSLYQELKM